MGVQSVGFVPTLSCIALTTVPRKPHLLGVNRGDTQVALIEGQTCCPYWGTNRLPLLRDKQVGLSGGQTDCPYWG